MSAKPDFGDRSRWKVIPAVTVFYEHERRRVKMSPDGKRAIETIKVTKADLVEAARVNNQQDAVGNPTALTIGHTTDDPDETAQPEIVGYAREYEVFWDAARNRWAVRANWYFHPEKYDRAREYPRVSPEYRPKAHLFDPIALLRRTPHLALQWTYSSTSRGPVIRYASTGDWTMPPPEEDRDQGQGGERTPTDPPDAQDGDDPEFHDRVMKCVRKGYPGIHEWHAKEGISKYAADAGAYPSATNAAPPGAADNTPPNEDERLRMSRTNENVLRYQRENKALQDRLNRLEQSERVMRYERTLVQLRDVEGYHHIDVEAELADPDVVAMTEPQFGRHVERLKRSGEHARGPAGTNLVPVAGSPTRHAAGGGKDMSDDQFEQVLAYQRSKECSYDEAEAAVLKAKK